ncbi:VOC family protein [Candidatus Mycobacterium methanotrophicum]
MQVGNGRPAPKAVDETQVQPPLLHGDTWLIKHRKVSTDWAAPDSAMAHKATVELVLDCADPETLAVFWREALNYRQYYTNAKLIVLVPKNGIASPLLLQCVPEPKAGKNRMHLDIVVDDIEAEAHRLQALGAQRIDEGVHAVGDTRWVRMADPEQNEFCVSTGVEW